MDKPLRPAHPSYLTTQREILAWLHAAHALEQFPPEQSVRRER